MHLILDSIKMECHPLNSKDPGTTKALTALVYPLGMGEAAKVAGADGRTSEAAFPARAGSITWFMVTPRTRIGLIGINELLARSPTWIP
jgi:hypothetical protein